MTYSLDDLAGAIAALLRRDVHIIVLPSSVSDDALSIICDDEPGLGTTSGRKSKQYLYGTPPASWWPRWDREETIDAPAGARCVYARAVRFVHEDYRARTLSEAAAEIAASMAPPKIPRPLSPALMPTYIGRYVPAA